MSIEDPRKKKTSFFEETGRAVVVVAALSGAVASPEVSAAETRQGTRLEQRETFNAERETKAFLKKVAAYDAGFDDARGRRMLATKVETAFNNFALALDQQRPYFSGGESVSIAGTITPVIRGKALQYLKIKLVTHATDGNPALEILRRMVTGSDSIKDSLSPQARERAEKMGF